MKFVVRSACDVFFPPHSPLRLMFGVPPVVPPAVRERMAEPLGFGGLGQVEGYARALSERAALLRRHAPIAAANLLAAQHRDTQRYALVRSGKYQPPAMHFLAGDYVYVRRLDVNNTLQMPVHDEVLRVERVGPMGVAVLIGRDGNRIRRRIEQLAPCHLPDIDPIVDVRLQRPPADLPAKCAARHAMAPACCCATRAGRAGTCSA